MRDADEVIEELRDTLGQTALEDRLGIIDDLVQQCERAFVSLAIGGDEITLFCIVKRHEDEDLIKALTGVAHAAISSVGDAVDSARIDQRMDKLGEIMAEAMIDKTGEKFPPDDDEGD